jgi:hypothetical protein
MISAIATVVRVKRPKSYPALAARRKRMPRRA